jgi:hypothetical protein
MFVGQGLRGLFFLGRLGIAGSGGQVAGEVAPGRTGAGAGQAAPRQALRPRTSLMYLTTFSRWRSVMIGGCEPGPGSR